MSFHLSIHAANNPIRARIDQHNSFAVLSLSVIGDEVKFFVQDTTQVEALIDAITQAMATKADHTRI